MLLCIDIGNTNIVIGVSDYKGILYHWRIRTDRDITADEIGIVVKNLFDSNGLSLESIKDVIISCVVPPLLNSFEEFSKRYLHSSPLVVGPGIRTGMPIYYENPKEIGADRIVNAVAAYEKYRSSLIVVDFGTATTFDCVTSEGAYIGGVIAPGIIISCEALFQKASKLPRVEIFARPEKVVAKDTIGAMNAGIIYGYAGLVDGIVRRIQAELGDDMTVIATGGLAHIIKEESETIQYVEDLLTLEGLLILFRRNKRI
ncbi:MAG TPA: type III pantothenate kinase [Desulfobacteraceae bacterium]|nr:type III pantothenate kinase [Desulfobacteraceae bacterium]